MTQDFKDDGLKNLFQKKDWPLSPAPQGEAQKIWRAIEGQSVSSKTTKKTWWPWMLVPTLSLGAWMFISSQMAPVALPLREADAIVNEEAYVVASFEALETDFDQAEQNLTEIF